MTDKPLINNEQALRQGRICAAVLLFALPAICIGLGLEIWQNHSPAQSVAAQTAAVILLITLAAVSAAISTTVICHTTRELRRLAPRPQRLLCTTLEKEAAR